ncbi:MAG: AMP-dependent synthetase [Candidatus Lokiarchaeota archaeon]|nr:AMP-dependent synthetase [Candidatus Lokiarchaeota archaeon]
MSNPYASRFWTKSYDKHVKPSLEPYPETNLIKMFDDSMSKYNDKICCWFMNRNIKFDEMRTYIHKFATFLQRNGLQKGDRVAINLINSPQYLIAHFGTILAGGAASGCSPLLSADELVYQINDSEAKFIITIDKVHEKVLYPVLNKVPNLKGIITVDLSSYMGFSKIKVFFGKLSKKIPKGKSLPYPGKIVLKLQDLLEKTPAELKEIKIEPEKDLALLQYTGGTTGTPKGTELTHANIGKHMLQIENWIGLEKGKEVALSAFPYFHLAGLIFCMMQIYLASCQILIPDPRNVKNLIKEWISKEPTLIAHVPTVFLMIMNNPKARDIPKNVTDKVKAMISGAAPFPAESIREFEEKMNAKNKILEVYGMTEASPLATGNPFKGTKKIGTVGLPLQDTEVKLVDIETGEPVELGNPGEILIKGPQITRGYYNKPEANKKTIKDGWLFTGDVGIMDEDGYITIVDRTKDMLIVSGYKVYSIHVEDVMTKHPDIELVAIVGIKDPNRPGSEIVKAYVQLKEGIKVTSEVEESIKSYAKENLSSYENPKLWEFKEQLPLTAVGKVLKRDLRVEANK